MEDVQYIHTINTKSVLWKGLLMAPQLQARLGFINKHRTASSKDDVPFTGKYNIQSLIHKSSRQYKIQTLHLQDKIYN